MIHNARESICIVSPVIQEEEVLSALREATQRNVSVRVVTQLGNHRTGQFITSPEFAGYDIPRRQLAELGACVRDWDVTVHAKLVLVDDSTFLFTTANLNENSLGSGAKNALEAAFLFENGPEIDAGRRLFNAIWEGSVIRQAKRDNLMAIVRQASKIRMPTAEDCAARIGSTEFLLSTPSNQFLARRIASMLQSAKREVVMTTMSIYDLENVPVLFKALSGVLERGVKVTVIARTGIEQFKPSQWPDPSTKKLMALGLKIVEVPHLHAKGVFIDGRTGMMMSANLNPYSLGNLETSHVEIAVQAPTSLQWMEGFRRFSYSLLTGEQRQSN